MTSASEGEVGISLKWAKWDLHGKKGDVGPWTAAYKNVSSLVRAYGDNANLTNTKTVKYIRSYVFCQVL